MKKTRYHSLAQAIGAFVAAEMERCLVEPTRLLLEEQFEENAEWRYAPGEFDMHKFVQHLTGGLDDLVYLCSYDDKTKQPLYHDYVGEVDVIYESEDDGKHEWLACAQGYVRIEAV